MNFERLGVTPDGQIAIKSFDPPFDEKGGVILISKFELSPDKREVEIEYTASPDLSEDPQLKAWLSEFVLATLERVIENLETETEDLSQP